MPVSGTTNTAPANYRRGYIESWNLFVQQDLGAKFVANIGYVGTHQVRQLGGVTLNAGTAPQRLDHLHGQRTIQPLLRALRNL